MRTYDTAEPGRPRAPLALRQMGVAVVGLLGALSLSCGGPGDGDGGNPRTDGGGPVTGMCSGQPPAELGRCELVGGGECRGAPGEVSSFVALGGGATMRMVIGPQGAQMLVFAMRAPGIAVGSSGSDWPIVEVGLSNGTRQLAYYMARQEFTGGGTPEALQLWVVIGEGVAGDIIGRSVGVVATVRDNTGLELCGTASITVGR